MRQMGNTNSFGFIADTLLANPEVTKGLSALFAARFDPAVDEDQRGAKAKNSPGELVRSHQARSQRSTPTASFVRS